MCVTLHDIYWYISCANDQWILGHLLYSKNNADNVRIFFNYLPKYTRRLWGRVVGKKQPYYGPSRSTYDLWTNSVAANHGSRLALMCHRPSADSGARALVVLSPRKRRGHTGYTSRLALSLSAYYHLRVESICFFPFFICVISSKNPKRRYLYEYVDFLLENNISF
jgi:hypothetical protein